MYRSLAPLLAALVVAGCAGAAPEPPDRPPTPSGPASAAPPSGHGAPDVAGRVESDDVRESSGLAASPCQDVLWTLNDSGNDPVIYAMDTRGRDLGTWEVPDAENVDWESVAAYRDPAGACWLLVGDIGDNDRERPEVEVYRVPEPAVSSGSTGSDPSATEPARSTRFTYPGGSANAETLLAWPGTGDMYVVTKNESGPAGVFRIPAGFDGDAAVTAEKVADLTVPADPEGRLTDGAVSPDGSRVVLCDEQGGYELVLPAGADPDAVWRQTPAPVDLGDRKQGEGVTYSPDGRSLYASSEGRNAPLYRIERA